MQHGIQFFFGRGIEMAIPSCLVLRVPAFASEGQPPSGREAAAGLPETDSRNRSSGNTQTPARVPTPNGLIPAYRRLLKMVLEELRFIEQHITQLDQEMAALLSQHQDAVQRLAEIPRLGVDSAQQIIAVSWRRRKRRNVPEPPLP